jgi:hypothetical protein
MELLKRTRAGRVAAATVVLVSLLPVACTSVSEVDVPGTATVLIGVVAAGADSVFVTIGNTFGSSLTPEPGALLSLSGHAFEVMLDEREQGECGGPIEFSCYAAAVEPPVKPNQLVRIQGRLPDGREISGETVVPGPPLVTVEGALAGDTIRYGSVQARQISPEILGTRDEPNRLGVAGPLVTATVWSGSQNRRCSVAVLPPPNIDLRDPQFTRIGMRIHAPVCGEPTAAWDSMAVPFTVLAFDDNFTEWAAAEPGGPAGDGSFGVSGLHGVFGSATPRTFIVIATP